MQRRLRFAEPVMRALRTAASDVLACGLDTAWLVAISGALFRLFPGNPRLHLMLMCPCRDGVDEARLVGFIGERRIIPVDVGDTTMATLLEVAEVVSGARRKRSWHTPVPFEAGLCVYINIVSAMRDGLPHGFRQVMPQPKYYPGKWQCNARHPVNIRLDQITELDWDLKLSQYDARWGWSWSTHFAQALGGVIGDMASDPYAPLVPSKGASQDSGGFVAGGGVKRKASAPAPPEPSDEAAQALELEDDDGQQFEMVSHRRLEPERGAIYAAAFPDCRSFGLRAIVGRSESGQVLEFLAVERGPPPVLELVSGSCAITLETLPPSSCVEYCFGEEPDKWCLAQVSLDALTTWRRQKFEFWRGMLLKPTCEAQFRRMLQIGVITQLYDSKLFPTPDATKHLYQVTDEKNGKIIDLPHPVAHLRKWDAVSQRYEMIDPHLDGAPSEAEKEAWWRAQVEELAELHGAEYLVVLHPGAGAAANNPSPAAKAQGDSQESGGFVAESGMKRKVLSSAPEELDMLEGARLEGEVEPVGPAPKRPRE